MILARRSWLRFASFVMSVNAVSVLASSSPSQATTQSAERWMEAMELTWAYRFWVSS